MPRRGNAPVNAPDIAIEDHRSKVWEQIRKADAPLLTNHPPAVESPPALRNRCAGPGCGLSKSAFHSTEEFTLHRQLCEPNS